MEVVKKLSELIELMYLCERPKRRIFSEVESALLAIVSPVLVVLSKGAAFPLLIILLSIALSIMIGEKFLRFLKSTLFFIPLFSLAIAIPRAFLEPSYGLSGAAIFTLRVWAALSIPTLIARSYGIPYISIGLASLGLPKDLAMLISISSIDIITSARIIWNSALALASRGAPKLGIRELGYFAGYQLVRGYERGERVNMAFIMRGGEETVRKSVLSIKFTLLMLLLLFSFIVLGVIFPVF
ncbi:MAG: hypothetical protein QXM14_01460 [Fervidicoccaceae archaeon]